MIVAKGLKRELLSALSEKELDGFVKLFRKIHKPYGTSIEFLSRLETRELFGALHKLLFGRWDLSDSVFPKVMNNIGRVKELLDAIIVPDTSPGCPEMPAGFLVENLESGKVSVTKHAWFRFWERFCHCSNSSAGQIGQILAQSFAGAKKIELGSYAVLRAINNGFQQTDYFLDAPRNCRYIVSALKGRLFLVTVERPKH